MICYISINLLHSYWFIVVRDFSVGAVCIFFVLHVFDNFKYVLVGLTVLKADEVYDIMERDYPEKFKVCCRIFLVFFEAPIFAFFYHESA